MNNRTLHHLKMVSKLYTQKEVCQHLQDIHSEAQHFAHAFRMVQSRAQNGFRIVCNLRLLKT